MSLNIKIPETEERAHILAGETVTRAVTGALDRATGEPLLFKGMDFSKTDRPSIL